MNRTASIRIRGLDLKYLKENALMIFLLALTVISMLIGIITSNNHSGLAEFVKESFTEQIKTRAGMSFFKSFINSLLSALPIPIICFLAGTSIVGLVVSPITIVFASFWYGGVAGLLYSTYGLTGIMFNIFVLLPPILLVLFALLLSSCEAINFSRRIAAMCIRDTRPLNLYNDFRGYCLKHILILIIILISSLCDATLFNLFEKYFKF